MHTTSQDNGRTKELFKDIQTTKMTLLIWFNWFTLSFVYYGIVILMPYLLSLQKNQILSNEILLLVLTNVCEIFGAGCASVFIEIRGLGRKNSIGYSFLISSCTCLVVFFLQGEEFVCWAILTRFVLSMAFIFSYQYTVEIYPTKIRGTGIGMANGVGRIGGVFMPFIVMYLTTNVQMFSPFLLFAVLGLVTFLTNLGLPNDTLGKELDE